MKNEEYLLQCAFVHWFRVQHPDKLLWHTPNGGQRNKIVAAKLKRMGTLAGVPDIFIAEPVEKHHGLFIEMKAGSGRLSKAQTALMKRLIERGYCGSVTNSVEGGMEIVKRYFA